MKTLIPPIVRYFLFSIFYFLFSIFPASAQFNIIPAAANATCPADSNGSLSVSVSGGTAPYTYQWLPDGQTSPTITGLTPGNYSVTISDNAGKDSIVSYAVGPAPITNDSTNNIQSPICANEGRIQLNISGGTASYTYLWSTGSANPVISQLSEGNYSVIVTDANNCTASFSFPLKKGECFVSPAQYFTPNGDGYNDTWSIDNSQFFPDARLIVFNRWGTRVHEHNGLYEPWDGKSYLGIQVPDAVYYYFFYQDKNDKEKNAIRGSVTIIR